MDQVIRSFNAVVDDVNNADRSITAKINDFSLDRYASVIDARGADLKGFLRSPVVLWEHGKDTVNRGPLPVGKNLWIRVDRGTNPKIIARTQFKKDDFSMMLYDAYSNRDMSSWSVSLLPLEFGAPTKEEVRSRPELSNCDVVYRTWELLEYSACAIGGNSTCITMDEARSISKLVVRGFYVPPEEFKEAVEKAMSESGGASGGILVKPKTKGVDDEDDTPEVEEGITVSPGSTVIISDTLNPDETVEEGIECDDDEKPKKRDAEDLEVVEETIDAPTNEPSLVERIIEAKIEHADLTVDEVEERLAIVEPVLPPLTGPTFQQVVGRRIMEEREFRFRMEQKIDDWFDWLHGKA